MNVRREGGYKVIIKKCRLIQWIYELQFSNEELFDRANGIVASLPFMQDVEDEGQSRMVLVQKNENLMIRYGDEMCCFFNIQKSDLYPILYGTIYYCTIMQHHLLVHSSVVSNSKHTWMILGDFGSGKSFFSGCFQKKNWEIISADQTLLGLKDDVWHVLCGSTYFKLDQTEGRIAFDGYPKVLDRIIVLRGLAKRGEAKIRKVDDQNGTVKKIVYALMWPYVTPLSTGKIFTFHYIEYCEVVAEMLNGFQTMPVFHIRGDAEICVELLQQI